MTKTDTPAPSELKTIGFTPFIFCSDQALFHVSRGVPLAEALAQASNLLFLAKEPVSYTHLTLPTILLV